MPGINGNESSRMAGQCKQDDHETTERERVNVFARIQSFDRVSKRARNYWLEKPWENAKASTMFLPNDGSIPRILVILSSSRVFKILQVLLGN